MKKFSWVKKSKKLPVDGDDLPSFPAYAFDPLYAQSLDKEHLSYASTLDEAISDPRIKNIALTGSYGSGKSSILDAFESDKKERVVRVSFSSLGAKIEEKIIDSEDTSDEKTGVIRNLTNLIQKEVVKQILFKEAPSNLPNSKFRRISRMHLRSVVFPALFFASIGLLLLFMFDVLKIVPVVANDNIYVVMLIMTGILSVLTLIFIVFASIIGKSLRIEKISGGPLTLGLTGTNSYFDEYLDEILYFFETTKYDIVLIEDIDRFKKLYIFESLRQLSAIINSSSQVGKTVRFVYALKDSIFADGTDVLEATKKDNKDSQAVVPLPKNLDQAANRTKFFDLIIPVVPFLSHTTSSNYIVDVLEKRKLKVDSRVVKIVSPYLTDMRLIKNICNEYAVFNEKILGDKTIESLKKENLFALVVYKNLFLGDFERIKNGQSILNEVLRYSRNFVQDETIALTASQQSLQDDLDSDKELTIKSSTYGNKLTSYLDAVALGINASVLAYEYDEDSVEKDFFSQHDFWVAVSAMNSDDEVVTVTMRNTATLASQRFVVNKKSLETMVLGHEVDADEWKSVQVEKINSRIVEIKRELKKIQAMDISGLMNHYEDSFGSEVESIVGNDMVVSLLRAGFIDQYFALYTATYHPGTLSGNAMNFMIHNVDTYTMDPFYKFNSNSDIDNLLVELGESRLNNPALFNIDILDYLLKFKSSGRMQLVAESIMRQDNFADVIDIYLNQGKYGKKLISFLTPIMPTVFDYIFSTSSIRDTERKTLLAQAVVSMNSSVNYSLNKKTESELAKLVDTLSTVITEDNKEATNLVSLMKKAELKFTNISKFSSVVQAAAAKAAVYEVNKENLKIILGSSVNLALDSIKKADNATYQYVITQLSRYVDMLHSNKIKHSILDKQLAPVILTDIAKSDTKLIDTIIAHVDSSNVFIDDINDIPKRIWAFALEHTIINTMLSNSLEYFAHFNQEDEEIDESLGMYLRDINGSLAIDKKDLGEYDQETLRKFVVACLNSGYISKEVKTTIVTSYLNVGLDIAQLTLDETTPLKQLLQAKRIEDTIENFTVIQKRPWLVIEEYIENSEEFPNYIDEVEFTSSLFQDMVSSSKVPYAVKSYVLKHLEDFEAILTEVGANALLRFALSGSWNLTTAHQLILYKLTKNQESRTRLFVSSQKNVSTIANAELLMKSMDEPYSKLARKGSSPKFDDTEVNRNFIGVLQSLGMVSKIVPDEKLKVIRVYMKRKW